MNTAENLHEDRKWIALAQKDRRAFGFLYEKYFEQIYLFIYKRVGDQELAGDICQESMLKAMHNISKFEDRGFQFKSWLYRIASNEVNQFFRKNKNKVCVSIEEKNLVNLLDEAGEEDKNEVIYAKLLDTLANLEPGTSEIIELRFFSGFSFKEIAEFYEITEANAKMRLYRLLDKIKKSLSE